MNGRLIRSLIGLILLCSGCASVSTKSSTRLDLIKKRDQLHCGVSGKIPGFSFLASDGSYKGLDVDICRAMAAAFLGDESKVQYRALTAPERFTALKTGEIDLLSRNTTFNLSRDAAGGNGLSFSPAVFHDGQGLMVKRTSNINKIGDLDSANICVGSGTTTEQNLNDAFQERQLSYTPIKYQDLNQVVAGYLQGRCVAMTSDRSQLAAARSAFPDSENHTIMDIVLSKEPLAPASVGNDQRLSDAMRWVVFALIAAEEFNITQENIDSKRQEAIDNPQMSSLRRFLGIDGSLGEKLGLSDDFVVNIIRATGNYGEIYNRHLGSNSSVPIPRGTNRSYLKGGVMISPPFN